MQNGSLSQGGYSWQGCPVNAVFIFDCEASLGREVSHRHGGYREFEAPHLAPQRRDLPKDEQGGLGLAVAQANSGLQKAV